MRYNTLVNADAQGRPVAARSSPLRANGISAGKSYVKAEELLAWCLAHNKPNDGAARAQFVSMQGRKAHESGG